MNVLIERVLSFELASYLILHVYLPKYEGGDKPEVRGRFRDYFPMVADRWFVFFLLFVSYISIFIFLLSTREKFSFNLIAIFCNKIFPTRIFFIRFGSVHL